MLKIFTFYFSFDSVWSKTKMNTNADLFLLSIEKFAYVLSLRPKTGSTRFATKAGFFAFAFFFFYRRIENWQSQDNCESNQIDTGQAANGFTLFYWKTLHFFICISPNNQMKTLWIGLGLICRIHNCQQKECCWPDCRCTMCHSDFISIFFANVNVQIETKKKDERNGLKMCND